MTLMKTVVLGLPVSLLVIAVPVSAQTGARSSTYPTIIATTPGPVLPALPPINATTRGPVLPALPPIIATTPGPVLPALPPITATTRGPILPALPPIIATAPGPVLPALPALSPTLLPSTPGAPVIVGPDGQVHAPRNDARERTHPANQHRRRSNR